MGKEELGRHELFMRRALDLAKQGLGRVSPNPLVGCVIVHGGKVVGEGWHKQYGGAHAEVNAVESVSDKSLLQHSTLYVNLEPCSHFGKTPPCADMLIRERVQKVVIANVDSNPLVAGKGINKLTEAGIEVLTGVLEQQGRDLNKRFFTFIEKKRPYIILKWAQTADGFIARKNFDSRWISNTYSRQLVHKWRTEEDAIMVGTNTALYDNPTLNVRDWSGRNPTRIVLDRFLKLKNDLTVFDQTQTTICYNTIKDEQHTNLSFVNVDTDSFLEGVVDNLYVQKIGSVIVEGGAETLNMLIQKDLWDEARVFTSKQIFKEGITAPIIKAAHYSRLDVQGDTLDTYKPYT